MPLLVADLLLDQCTAIPDGYQEWAWSPIRLGDLIWIKLGYG